MESGPITKSGVLFCFELRAFCSDIIQFSATFLVVVIRNLVKSFSKNAKKCQIGKKYKTKSNKCRNKKEAKFEYPLSNFGSYMGQKSPKMC